MENLKAIINIVKTVNVKSSDLLSTKLSKNSKTNTFYKKILNNEFQTDDDAAGFFYDASPNNSSYKNLKSKLREKLVNTLFFLNHSKGHSGYSRAMIYCSKYLAAARILIYMGGRQASIDLCKKVLKKAQEYELTEFILKSAVYLQGYSLTLYKDEKKYEHYNQLVRTYSKMQQAEYEATEYYHRLIIPHLKGIPDRVFIAESAQQFHDRLKPLLEEFESPYLHMIAYYIESILHFSKNNYQQIISMGERGIQFFENKPYTFDNPIRSLLHYMMLAYIQLRDFRQGKEIADKSISRVQEGSLNWFVSQELKLMLAFHSKEYKAGFFTVHETINHRKFKTTDNHTKEKWLIYEAYANFLISIDKIQLTQEEQKIQLRKFRPARFLNSIPIFSSDKRGLNIPVLIVQILFMIVRKDYDQAVDRIEAIEKYCSRYLKKNDNFRSNCFIKALLQVPICSFHKAGVERKSEKYINQLKSVPLEVSNQSHEVEIIPYEDLWFYIIDSLETKFHKSKR